MFNIQQFRESIIVPVLSKLQMYSKEAEELLVFTCAAESLGGTLLTQVKGPALGIYQCEPNTHMDIWKNYIYNRQSLVAILGLNFACNNVPQPERLVYDIGYATAICRLHYMRVKENLPNVEDIDGIWEYYKKYYNTELGKATKDESIAKYRAFLGKPKKTSQ